ncbi:MAG: NAD(P)-dependent oxidoreductase, partial [Gammaproteobacteria bacterium]
TLDHPRVEKLHGDGFDEISIVAALEGADAVITTLGKTNLRDKRYNLSTAAHRSVIEGMRANKIRRLIVISSIGAAQGIERKGWRRNLYLLLRRKYYRDMFQMEQEVLASGIDVTVLRAPMLYNGPATGNFRIIETEDYFEGLRISRADLANFLVNELSNNLWINRTIAIADL